MTYPIENLTEKEQRVLSTVAHYGFDGCCAWIEDIIRDTKLSSKVIRGVLSSLVKKRHIYIEEREIVEVIKIQKKTDIFFCVGKNVLSHANEDNELSEEEVKLAQRVANYKFARVAQ